jgi:hypothetical protein
MTKSRSRHKKQISDPLTDLSDGEIQSYLLQNLTTPPAIDKQVLQFCKRLSPRENPVFLTVQPANWSRLNYCNKNVEKMVQLHGGVMVYGYKIWYVPRIYIEAERHTVWKNPDGHIVDVTFNPDGEERILFLPVPGLKTVLTATLQRPREVFHPRIDKIMQHQEMMETMTLVKSDDTWEGWERAVSFEIWKQKHQI